MRLINADELKGKAFADPDDGEYFVYCQDIDEAPTVDAVPVVRCKDCKYYKPDEYECGCDFAGGLPYVKAGDFCSYGQRRAQFAGDGNMDGGDRDGK